VQDKSKEKAFFDKFSSAKEYDVLTREGYRRIIEEYLKLIDKFVSDKPGALKIIDLGCGTGAFTRVFKEMVDNDFFGLDISVKSAALAAKLSPAIHYCAGDIEQCCFKDETFDIVLFSGVLHHFEDFDTCLREAHRILKYSGCVLSYDPNIKNPFMWLYRHPSSPFFSQKGKTENERLLSAEQVRSAMEKTGFCNVVTRCKSGITFKYIESTVGRFFLPFYNLFEVLLGISPLASRYGSFLIGYGKKA